MKSKANILLILLLSLAAALEVVVNSNVDPYLALQEAMGKKAVQTSDDCDDKLKHITVANDPILKRNVFVYHLHRHGNYHDGDRCNGEYDRQRVESSVQGSSPDWQKGYQGKTFSYAWKLYLDKDFQFSGYFCHLHQIKIDGSGGILPNLTLTARKDMQLENEDRILAKVPIASFKGEWIQIREKITFGAQGCLDFTAHRIRDNYLLLSYKGCDVKLNNNGLMIRPKFGFYRSLEDETKLRDQAVRIVDLCLGEGDSCKYNGYGVKMDVEANLMRI